VVEIAFGRLKAHWHQLSNRSIYTLTTHHMLSQLAVFYTMCVKCMGILLMKSGCKTLVVLRI